MPALKHVLQAKAAHAIFALPDPILRGLAGAPRLRPDGVPLELRSQIIARLSDVGTPPPLTAQSAALHRTHQMESIPAVAPPVSPEVRWDDHLLESAVGTPLRARLYTPKDLLRPAPLLVYFHGGGFVLGEIEGHHPWCAELAQKAGVRVLSAEYRLAPEHRFPAAVDDAWAIWTQVCDAPALFGADPHRLGVAGDSAGGNLAAVVSWLAANDEFVPLPALQVPLYPAVDRVGHYASQEHFATGLLLTTDKMNRFTDLYVDPQQHQDPRVSPLLADDLSKLPPSIVVTAGFDVLRDEGRVYAQALKDAGVDVVFMEAEGLLHGFVNMTGAIPVARHFVEQLAAEIRQRL